MVFFMIQLSAVLSVTAGIVALINPDRMRNYQQSCAILLPPNASSSRPFTPGLWRGRSPNVAVFSQFTLPILIFRLYGTASA